MAESLQVFANSYSAEPRNSVRNIDSDYANNIALIKKYKRMVSRFPIVGMVLHINLVLTAILKQHPAANRMKYTLLIIASGRPQFVFVLHQRLRPTPICFSMIPPGLVSKFIF